MGDVRPPFYGSGTVEAPEGAVAPPVAPTASILPDECAYQPKGHKRPCGWPRRFHENGRVMEDDQGWTHEFQEANGPMSDLAIGRGSWEQFLSTGDEAFIANMKPDEMRELLRWHLAPIVLAAAEFDRYAIRMTTEEHSGTMDARVRERLSRGWLGSSVHTALRGVTDE